MESETRVAEDVNAALRALVLARDEARLKAHLLSLEARERLENLEQDIERFEWQLSSRNEWVAEHVTSAAASLTGALRRLLQGEELEPTRARDVMSRNPATCHANDPLTRAAQLMWENDCGAIPVVDDSQQLVGIVTDRDICMAAYTQGKPLSEMRVESAMARNPITCSPRAPLREVMDSMAVEQLRRIPVVEDGRVVGIISLADVAQLAQAPSLESQEPRSWVPGVLASISRRDKGSSGPPQERRSA